MPPHDPVQLEHVANQVIVTIAVQEVNGEDKLFLYPQRSSDVIAYYRDSPDVGDPSKPREIRWVVTGLKQGQKIEIEAKPGFQNKFNKNKFTIEYPDNSVCSGPPKFKAAPAYSHLWRYSVRLKMGTTGVDAIDPDVEIKDDP